MKGTMRTMAQTAALMAILTLISKLFGFIREMVMAGYFGTSYIVDAYVMATAIPGIIFTGIFASVATAYMPILSVKIEKEGESSANLFTSHIINLIFIVSIISAIVGLAFSDQIVDIFASGFTKETAELTSFFVKVSFSYVFFSSASGILESFLQYKNTFLPQIIVGYTQNLIVIGAIILSAASSYYFLPFGLLIAYVVRLLILKRLADKQGMRYKFSFKSLETVKLMMPLVIPTFIGTSISQISVFVDKTLASGLVEGSVSALNYASLLNSLIMALSTTVLTTIIYPRLTQANSLEDYTRFNDIIKKGLALIFIITLPFSLGAMVYSQQVVQIVYERGAFNMAATSLTQSAYLCYSAGLLFTALNALLNQVYFSMHDMKTPMIFGGISVIIDIVLNLILVQSMAHNGLALATSIGALCNTIILLIGLRRKYPGVSITESKYKFVKITIASVVSVGISYLVYIFVILPLSHVIYMRTVQLGLAVITAGLVYLVILKLFRISELELLKTLFVRNQR